MDQVDDSNVSHLKAMFSETKQVNLYLAVVGVPKEQAVMNQFICGERANSGRGFGGRGSSGKRSSGWGSNNVVGLHVSPSVPENIEIDTPSNVSDSEEDPSGTFQERTLPLTDVQAENLFEFGEPVDFDKVCLMMKTLTNHG